MECSECGFVYSDRDARDRARHREIHDKILNGVPCPLVEDKHIVWHGEKPTLEQVIKDDIPRPSVFVVTPQSPPKLRKLAEEVSRLANIETQYTGGVYVATEPPDPERDRHLFLYRLYGRIAGLVVFDQRSTAHVATWQEYDEGAESNWAETAPFWSISYIWTLRKYRRTSIATRLLDIAANHFGTAVDRLGITAPLTQPGEAFARSQWQDIVQLTT
jgi:hypothetical protein